MSPVSIAILGLNGTLGAPTLAALELPKFADKVKFPVLAITRDPSKKTSTKHVKYVQGDYAKGADDIAEKLKGVDVIVELLSPTPDIFAATEKIAFAVKPKLYIPSQFGTDIPASDAIFPGFIGIKTEHTNRLRKGGIKVVDIITSLFRADGAFLTEIVGHMGANVDTKKVRYLGSPDQKFHFTTLPDIGRVIASVLTTDPAKLPDTLRVFSDVSTPRTVVERYSKTHGVQFTEEGLISKEQALAEGQKLWKEKGFDLSQFLYYLQVIVSQGEDKGLYFSKNDRELVNPNESLWKWESL